jgi:hypothetical protein
LDRSLNNAIRAINCAGSARVVRNIDVLTLHAAQAIQTLCRSVNRSTSWTIAMRRGFFESIALFDAFSRLLPAINGQSHT